MTLLKETHTLNMLGLFAALGRRNLIHVSQYEISM